MDPITSIGIVASLIQIIDGTGKALRYIDDTRNAFKQREKLHREATDLLSILANLRQKISQEPALPDLGHAAVLPQLLDRIKSALEELTRKISPPHRSGIQNSNIWSSLQWTAKKQD